MKYICGYILQEHKCANLVSLHMPGSNINILPTTSQQCLTASSVTNVADPRSLCANKENVG